MKIKKYIYTTIILVLIVSFLLFKRNQINNTIASEQMTIYLYFDSYTKQYGYPLNKNQFKDFIKYYENVNKEESNVWDYEYEFIDKNDSININLKSIYFYNKPNILKVKKVN